MYRRCADCCFRHRGAGPLRPRARRPDPLPHPARPARALAYPADLADTLGISRTRLSNHLACLWDCGLVVTVPDGRRTRYGLAAERLGHALDDLRTAVVAVETDCTCVDADEKGYC
ncbi:hypothetical protein STPH2_1415 [Streptomyces sp. KO7888]|nr:hypothetical protein [Streptomyces sp. KO7888]